jgi:hypothetical protein
VATTSVGSTASAGFFFLRSMAHSQVQCAINKGPMATKELRDLLAMYQHAYNTYMGCVEALSQATQHGVWPSAGVLGTEERALNELNVRRQALLDALYSHSRRANK